MNKTEPCLQEVNQGLQKPILVSKDSSEMNGPKSGSKKRVTFKRCVECHIYPDNWDMEPDKTFYVLKDTNLVELPSAQPVDEPAKETSGEEASNNVLNS